MPEHILVINAGSSTLKYARYDVQTLECLEREKIDIHGHSYETALKNIIHDADNLKAVGHRVVHGGQQFTTPALINDAVLDALEALTPLAPLHQPHNLGAITALRARYPELPQVACFDTAFHRTQSRINQLYALPRALSDEGLIRYGFHGLSYDYIASVLPDYTDKADGKVVVLHLGSGASACAMRNRQSVATTMGFTALEGLMMATRCGSIDPGILLYLQQEKGLSVANIEDLLYHQSGLYGVSGVSGDIRDLIKQPDHHAQEAIDLFCHSVITGIGQMAGALQGLDVVVFTGGIGEHQSVIRDKIIEQIQWLDPDIHIIPTNEEIVVARAVHKALNIV